MSLSEQSHFFLLSSKEKKKEVPKAKGMMLYSYFGIVTKVTGR